MLPVTVSISNTIKHCNETPNLRDIQNETIDPSIYKTKFFGYCENNHYVAATISSVCASVPPISHFLKLIMVVCGNILYLWALLVFIKMLR